MARSTFDCVMITRRSAAPSPAPPRGVKRERATPALADSTIVRSGSRVRMFVKAEDDAADSDSSLSSRAPSEADDSDDEGSESSFAPSDDDEAHPPKRRRTASSHVNVKAEGYEVRIKPEHDDDADEKKASPEDEASITYPRPESLADLQVFMPETLPEVFRNENEGTARMVELGGSKREDLGGPLQEVRWHIERPKRDKFTEEIIHDPATGAECWNKGTRPWAYQVSRGTYKASLNFGCRGPGHPFVRTATVYEAEDDAPECAIWIRDKKGGEPWRPYGIYKEIWCGRALDGEFDALADVPGGAAAQARAVNAFTQYLRAPTPKVYNEAVFKGLKFAETGELLWDTRLTADEQAQCARIRQALSENKGLNVGYAVSVYVRPIVDAELDAVGTLRALRRDRDDTAEASKRAQKAFKATRNSLGVATGDKAVAAKIAVDQAREALTSAQEQAKAALSAFVGEKTRRKALADKEKRQYDAEQRAKKKVLLKDQAAERARRAAT